MSRLTGEALDEAKFMVDEPREEPDEDDDGYCPDCSGSGEGRHEGERCSRCKGKGHAS